MIKVLHIDDDLNHHELVKAQLAQYSDDISLSRVESAQAALVALQDEIFDGILTDDRMPDACGLGLLKELRRIGNPIPFVILSEIGDEKGHHFLKNVIPEDEFHILVDYFHFDFLNYWIHRLDDRFRQLLRENKLKTELFSGSPKKMEALREAVKTLTEREKQILALIGAGKSNSEIAEELFISYKTVKNHVSNLFAKLGIHTRAEAIHLTLGLKISGGY